MNYKTLAKTFRKNGFDYQQVWREGDFAIYKQSKEGVTKNWFEAIQITRHDGYEIAGNKIEPSEIYPSNEKWGTFGFTCVDLSSAKKRIDFMKNHADKILLKNKESIVRGENKIKYPKNKEFCIKDLIPLNKTIKPHNFYPALKKLMEHGEIRESSRKSVGKGKAAVFYINN
jgi:hypothetical protein